MNTETVLLLGAGQAGMRFLRACMHLIEEEDWEAELHILESNQERATQICHELAMPVYLSLDEVCSRGIIPTSAIVTVPEAGHAAVLLELAARFPQLQKVICEKPLTISLSEALSVQKAFVGRELYVNFVERYSPAVTRLKEFMRQNHRSVLRGSCWWGKYRIKDARPTAGVVSVELAHPVDLMLYLAEITNDDAIVAGIAATASNISTGRDTGSVQLDTIQASIEFLHGPHFFLSTSLLWPARNRRLELILGDTEGMASELVSLRFDDPTWDCDLLEIFDIRAVGGRPELRLRLQVDERCWPSRRFTIGKVCDFLQDVLIFRGKTLRAPDVKQSILLQRILDEIESSAASCAVSAPIFLEPAIQDSNSIHPKLQSLKAIKNQLPEAGGLSMWDKNY